MRNRAGLRDWLDAWNLPVAVTPKVKGIVDETAPNFVGVVGGMAADGLMCEALQRADLLIGFGLDPVEIDKTWHADLPIRYVLEAPNAWRRVPEGRGLVDHAQVARRPSLRQPARALGSPFDEFQRTRRELLAGRSETATRCGPATSSRRLPRRCRLKPS